MTRLWLGRDHQTAATASGWSWRRTNKLSSIRVDVHYPSEGVAAATTTTPRDERRGGVGGYDGRRGRRRCGSRRRRRKNKMEGPEMEWTDEIRKSREIALVLGSGSQGLKQCRAKRSERQGRKARQAGPGETWKWRG